MFFSFVGVVMLISPLSSVSRVAGERAAEVGLPCKRVCLRISDVLSVNTRRFVHGPYGDFVGDTRSTATEQADARLCLVDEDLLAPGCAFLPCQDVLY